MKKNKTKFIICILLVLSAFLFIAGLKLNKSSKRITEKKYNGVVLGIKEVNYDADLPLKSEDGTDVMYSVYDLEDKLGIHLLRNNYFEYGDFFTASLEKQNDKISHAWLISQNNNCKKSKEILNLTLDISFVTKYNKEIKVSETIYLEENGRSNFYYKIRTLNVMAHVRVIYEVYFNKREPQQGLYRVSFEYDNIRYSFDLFMNYSDDAKGEDIIKDFLESFSYR